MQIDSEHATGAEVAGQDAPAEFEAEDGMKQTDHSHHGSGVGEIIKPPSMAKYFFALTSIERAPHAAVESLLSEKLGALDIRSEIFCFSDFSHYYDDELGGRCWKYLVSLKDLLPVDQIVATKLVTEELEESFGRHVKNVRRRTVNIDPGFLTGWQVVLSSAKNHSHRLYMGQGVYCELTLLYRDGDFQSLPWTYPDYVDSTVLGFLRRTRSEYRRQLKEVGTPEN